MAWSHDGCRPFTVGVPPHGEYGARRSAAFLGRAAARWAARALLGSGAAPRLRRARPLRDHGPKPHSGNDHRGCGGSATRWRAVGSRVRAHLLAILLARTGRCASHTHTCTRTHTCTCACACACACAHAHACACACACAHVAPSERRASAGAPEGEKGADCSESGSTLRAGTGAATFAAKGTPEAGHAASASESGLRPPWGPWGPREQAHRALWVIT